MRERFYSVAPNSEEEGHEECTCGRATCPVCAELNEVDTAEEEDEPAQEPEEGDITTTDHRHFYQDGKLRFTLTEKASGKFDMHIERYLNRLPMTVKDLATVKAAVNHYMQVDQFWPNCWFISDHGNAHLMEVA